MSNEALRSFSNSTFILREVQRDTGRVTDYVNSASGQTREGEISIICEDHLVTLPWGNIGQQDILYFNISIFRSKIPALVYVSDVS